MKNAMLCFMFIGLLSICGDLLSIETSRQVYEGGGLSISHDDWFMSCDNTHDCLILATEASNNHLSDRQFILELKRNAGSPASFEGKVLIIDSENTDVDYKTSHYELISLVINNKSLGFLTSNGMLNPTQLNALMTAIRINSKTPANIVFKEADKQWQLSMKGAFSTLKEVDVFQEREDTPSALMLVGKNKKPIPTWKKPVIKIERAKFRKHSMDNKSQQYDDIRRSILQNTDIEVLKFESRLPEDMDTATLLRMDFPNDLEFFMLNERKTMVRLPCPGYYPTYSEAYHWLVNSKKPYDAQLVTSGVYATYKPGILISSIWMKNGPFSCQESTEYAFNGDRFIRARQTIEGICDHQIPYWKSIQTFVSDISDK